MATVISLWRATADLIPRSLPCPTGTLFPDAELLSALCRETISWEWGRGIGVESLAGPPGILPAQWNARSDPSSRHPIPVRSLVTLLPPELGWGAVSCQTFGLLDQVVVTPNVAPFPFSTRRERVDWGFGRLWVVVAGVDPLRFLKPLLCGARGGPRGEPVCPLPAGFIDSWNRSCLLAAWNRSCLLLSSEAIRRASGTFPANRSDPPIGWLRKNIAPARSSTEESSSPSRRNAAFPAKSRACICANWLTATNAWYSTFTQDIVRRQHYTSRIKDMYRMFYFLLTKSQYYMIALFQKQ